MTLILRIYAAIVAGVLIGRAVYWGEPINAIAGVIILYLGFLLARAWETL